MRDGLCRARARATAAASAITIAPAWKAAAVAVARTAPRASSVTTAVSPIVPTTIAVVRVPQRVRVTSATRVRASAGSSHANAERADPIPGAASPTRNAPGMLAPETAAICSSRNRG